MTTTEQSLLTNGRGEVFYRVVLWSTHGHTYSVAHVWTTDEDDAVRQAQDEHLFTTRLVEVRPGTTGDLD